MIAKYAEPYCRECRQHFAYKNGNRDVNILEFAAAQKYCKENNLKFVVVNETSIKKLTDEEILQLRLSNEIKFVERYEQKFREKHKEVLLW